MRNRTIQLFARALTEGLEGLASSVGRERPRADRPPIWRRSRRERPSWRAIESSRGRHVPIIAYSGPRVQPLLAAAYF
jgi:hypothetical protein